MKHTFVGVTVIGLLLLLAYQTPSKPDRTIKVSIVSLEDIEDGNGLRHITVRMPDGDEVLIETLVPFFYKEGYEAKLAVYERFLFPDIHDLVAN